MKRAALWLGLAITAGGAAAQDRALREADAYYQRPLEDLLRVETQLKAEVGSRGGQRDALEAEVPIDVITAAQLESAGQTDLGRVLARLIPGFNFPRPSIADGTDHAPPFTLRGLNPDQMLVLVNGKRRHQSSLLNTNGTIGRGSSGVDINTIPLRAVERVEVLRDGAAAQYGSDAIAGIINIILKGYGHDSQASVAYGRSGRGDGILRQSDVFVSRALPEDGYINLTAEARDRGPTNRAGPDAADGGRISTHFGDADTQDLLMALNAEVPHGNLAWYLNATVDRRRSQAGAFFRYADDERNLPELYPQGFLPVIAPRILDYAFSTGVKGVLDDGTRWDLSYTHGHNDYHFYVEDSLNRSLGLATPTSFDSGGTRYTQQILNLDLNRRIGEHRLAGGLEYRNERYRIVAGDEASYALGAEHAWAAGAQGFGGFMPGNEVDVRRDNIAAYLDGKFALNERLSLDAAARGERYSDFGSTLDGKLALRARANDNLLLRASASSGFRAPSLTQSHFTSTAMVRDGEEILQYGTFGVDHPLARALGATDLKPEKSRHFTAGLVFQPNAELTLSADYFDTAIDDRIMATGYIAGWSLAELSPEALAILRQYGVDGAVYFTNAVSTRTRGHDLRLEYKRELSDGARLKLAGAYQRSRTRITGVNAAPAVLGVSMTDLILDPFTRVTMEHGQPVDSFKLWGKYETRAFDVVANLNRYGAYSSTSGYERVEFGARWTLDAELALHLDRDLTLALGGENLFNARPAEWGRTEDSLTGSGKVIPYSQYAPFGYNGAFYYARLTLRF